MTDILPLCGGMPPAISASGLCAGYGKTYILKELCLTVEAGSFTGLCGSNGAGACF
ncbi:MAG: hypothetical protein LBK13_07470 [Spirochaetales bacterium]|nr:hypothetical protein [Spirochaetales bacterium]